MASEETVIITEVLVPESEFVAEYTAPNPAKLLGTMLETMKGVWRVSSANVYTDKIKWDVTGEKVDFYGEWRCRDRRDQRTVLWSRITVLGTQDSKTKEGTVIVKLKPKLHVTIESKTAIDRAVKKMYLDMFYRDQFKLYMDIAKKRVNDFDDAIRLLLGIEERAAGSRPGSKM